MLALIGMQLFFLAKQTNDILLQVPKDPLNCGMVKIVNWMKTNDDKPCIVTGCLMMSTDQAVPSCFYFRMS